MKARTGPVRTLSKAKPKAAAKAKPSTVPRIAKTDGAAPVQAHASEAPASQLIDQRISELTGWRGALAGYQSLALGYTIVITYVPTRYSVIIKKLSAVGNSLGLIIERPILDLLDITKDTPLEVKTDGETLIIRPMKEDTWIDRALAAADELMDAHDATYRKLAK